MSTASYATYKKTSTFSALDGLRAVSILGVLWHHTGEPHTTVLGGRGFLGVDLFFVISGFLIVTLLLRERDRSGTISLRNFYIRRSLRIFPLYYATLAGLALLTLTVGRHGSQADTFFRELPAAAFYVANWLHPTGLLAITWSLAAEEQFYLVWPAVERFASRAAVALVVAGIAVSQLFAFGVFDDVFGFTPLTPFMLKQVGFTPILLGVGLAHALHDERSFGRVARVVDHGAVVIVVVAGIVALLAFGPADLRGGPRTLLHVLLTVLLAAAVVREDSPWNRVLRFRPFVRVGILSYGLYLLHMPARHVALMILTKVGVSQPAPLLLFTLTLVLALALAQTSFVFFERRFLALKQRFAP